MTVKGYKAFKSDWTCRGKQYRVGESYHEDEVELCKHGMHFCKELKDVFQYYYYNHNMKLARVEASGTVIQSGKDSKCVTSDLKVVKEINVDSEQVQLEAIKQNARAIKYMNNPSEQVQLEAVKVAGYAIKYIDKPSEQVQLEAVKQSMRAIHYIDNPSDHVQVEAVKRNGYAIKSIKNPCEQAQLEVIKQGGYDIRFIENPTKGLEGKEE